MSPPAQPRSTEPSSGGTGQIVLVVVVIIGCLAFVCCGGLAVLGALFYTRAQTTIAEVQQSVKDNIRSPPLPKWENDWVAMHALTGVYTKVVDTAVKDPRVIERLGEPIETIDNETGLFRRQNSGILSSQEIIEFDLKGPKGTATIKIECVTLTPHMGQRADKVIARFADETQIELPVPDTAPNGL